MLDNDFSKSDPKDALLVADNAQRGSYTRYRTFAKHIEAAHQLSITYDKLAKDRTQVKCRLRSFMERVFPEYLGAFDILTSLPNINENLAAQFIAETRGPDRFGHFKEIEKLAGNTCAAAPSSWASSSSRNGPRM